MNIQINRYKKKMSNMTEKPDTEQSSRTTHFGQINGV